jgi:hypothetical protein
MTVYILKGIVLPERAQITIFPIKQIHIDKATNEVKFETKLSINSNQITLWFHTNSEWELYELKNVIKIHISTILAIVGFINGCAYDIEITQVINEEKLIDHVYGIDIPCIWERNKNINFNDKLNGLFSKISNSGVNGIYLNRCFTDLIMAMKNPVDTGFYCYRAIESLREYCKNKFNIGKKNKEAQWKKLSEITGYIDLEDYIQVIMDFAYPVRHGDVIHITDSDRMEIFMKTWDVAKYRTKK